MRLVDFFTYTAATLACLITFFCGWLIALVIITKWPMVALLLTVVMAMILTFFMVKSMIEDRKARLEWEEIWKRYWERKDCDHY